MVRTSNNPQNRQKLLIGAGLSLANLVLIAGLAAAGMTVPAQAQGQNQEAVKKPSGGVACPSGWRVTEKSTSWCEPSETKSPLIYVKKDKESCASGYHEVYRVWCSTRRP
jgi:hypothetical protein